MKRDGKQRRRQKGRPVNGILVLDKPAGITSNAALQRCKYLLYAAKAGHTGSLDPLATGVLPICFGEATKFTQYLLDADKRYRSTFVLGTTTRTGDADGEIIAEANASGITAADVEQAMAGFRGNIMQVPSMYSALKQDGKPLYKLAREGVEVEREARPVTLYEYRLLNFEPANTAGKAHAEVEIHCSKGTYVRTLAEDLGKLLGCGAHVASLRRTGAGPFTEDQSIGLTELEKLREGRRGEDLDYLLKPTDAAISHLEALYLPESVAWYFRRGQPVMVPKVFEEAEEGDIVRVFQAKGPFLGIGEVMEDGRVTPRRLIENAV